MIIPMRYCLLCCKRYGLLLIFAVIVVFAIINLLYLDGNNIHVHSTVPTSKNDAEIIEEEISGKIPEKEIVISKIPSEAELRQKWIRDKVERLSKKVKGSNYDKILYVQPNVKPNYNVHVFYYPWYRNIQHDGEWSHWNHEYLPNWKKDDPKVYPTGRHKPPDDIGSNYYPVLGCYSSIDPEIIDSHMKQIRVAGIGVVSISWFPPPTKYTSDEYILTLLESAKKYDLHISVHLEPYEGRNAVNQRANIRYFIEKFGQHPSLHRMEVNGKDLPVFFVYDSYRIQSSDWKEVFSQNGKLSLRGTEYDGVFFGLLVDMQHRYEIKKSHFDGFYTYFATNGFSYGSSWKNWQSLGKFAQDQKLLFAPSIGPGYIDTTVRPWNAGNIRLRRHGRYYEVAWRAALSSQPAIVTITSFNEWHEGTQIEPALPKKTGNFTYLDYEPEGPYFYLNLTSYWIRKYSNNEIK